MKLAKDYRIKKHTKIIDELGNQILGMLNYPYPLTQHDKEVFYDSYKDRLYYVAQTLRLMKADNKKFRLSANRMFPDQLISSVLEPVFSYETFSTRLLDFSHRMLIEFLKGITYFQRNAADQVADRPIYHRTLSCGRHNALNELDCTGFYDNPQEFLRRSMKIRKCTIERSIYDKLFAKYFPSQEQNFSHRTFLTMTERDEYFGKCFRGTTIEVEVDFDLHGIPIEIEISQCNPNRIIIERYTKQTNIYNANALNWNNIGQFNIDEVNNIYGNDVVCRRLVYDRESLIKLYSKKIQTFTNPVDEWVVEDMNNLNTFSSDRAKSQLNDRVINEP
jgi:hypothetical protein